MRASEKRSNSAAVTDMANHANDKCQSIRQKRSVNMPRNSTFGWGNGVGNVDPVTSFVDFDLQSSTMFSVGITSGFLWESQIYLEYAYNDGELWLEWLRSDPFWDLLRDDPRFDKLVRRMNFPPAPQ